MKAKFGNLNFDSVETLSREELKKVKGGYGYDDGSPYGFNVSYTISCDCNGTQFTATTNYTGCCNRSNAIDSCAYAYRNLYGNSCPAFLFATTC